MSETSLSARLLVLPHCVTRNPDPHKTNLFVSPFSTNECMNEMLRLTLGERQFLSVPYLGALASFQKKQGIKPDLDCAQRFAASEWGVEAVLYSITEFDSLLDEYSERSSKELHNLLSQQDVKDLFDISTSLVERFNRENILPFEKHPVEMKNGKHLQRNFVPISEVRRLTEWVLPESHPPVAPDPAGPAEL
jgi:hypothetical protein